MKFHTARQAIADSYGARLGSTWEPDRGTKRDNCNRIWNDLQRGKIIAVVSRMPSAQNSWALWCYTDLGTKAHERTIFDFLCEKLDESPPVEYRKLGAMRRAMELLVLVMDDTKNRERNGREKYPLSILAQRIGVDRSQFSADRFWGIFHHSIHGHLDKLIATTLGPVAQVIKETEEKQSA